MTNNNSKEWVKVLDDASQLPEGRVMSVTANRHYICLTHFKGKFSGLNNHCPHQGGPLGEGSIENGLLRCPWHGWDFDPHTGQSPGSHDDGIQTYPIDVREDGVYVEVEKEATPEQTVSDVMVETMINWGVTHVFGMVGHSNLGFADAMRRAEEKGKLTYIGIRHEGAASFAASAYGKLTGKPAGCFAIAGPGSTNMYTGLWDAKVDRAPILALTGQVNTQVVGTGTFQEVDLKQAFESVAEFNHVVLRDSEHSELMALAVKHAIIRRDVSHLTFPDEVQVLKSRPGQKAKTPDGRITSFEIRPPEDAVNKALKMLKNAERPVIIVGHGARFHMEAVIQLAEKMDAPVLTTFKGKGLISDDHPLGCGVLGRSGTPIASWMMNEADLLCVIGASFSNHTGITPKIPTIQIDFDPLALSKFHKIEAPVWGEIGATVSILLKEFSDSPKQSDRRKEVAERWKLWREEKQKRLLEDRGKGISSIAVFDAMNRTIPENAIMTVDVGNNAYSFGRYFESRHQSFIMSGYLGSIGFAYPAAMGAWAADPSRPIVAVSGDGGFVQYMGEMTTAVKYGIPVKHILLNNFELGKISKEQRAEKFKVWHTSLSNPNFTDYAQGCGALGIRVTQKEALDEALSELIDHDGPGMVEVIADPALI